MRALWLYIPLLLLIPARVSAGPVEQWLAARELVTVARQERDAVLLAAAGRQTALAETVDPSLADARENAATLLSEADRLADGDELARKLTQRWQGMMNRGSNTGRSLVALALQPGESRMVERSFAAGQSAIVYADAAGPYELDVQGLAGADCRRRAARGEILCRWIPAAPAPVRIMLRNLGAMPLMLTLITN